MIDINENTYCLGVWFLEGEGSDWLAVVTRENDGPLTLTYRFRYYRDSKAFDSETEGGLVALHLAASAMPPPVQPLGAQSSLFLEAMT